MKPALAATSLVMPGPRIKSGGVPGISLDQVRLSSSNHMDGRDKPCHDVKRGITQTSRSRY